jgi:hypothetical protein
LIRADHRLSTSPRFAGQAFNELTVNEFQGRRRVVLHTGCEHGPHFMQERRIAGLGGEIPLELGPAHPRPFMVEVRPETLNDSPGSNGPPGHRVPQVEEIATAAPLIEGPELRGEQLVEFVRPNASVPGERPLQR